MFKKVNYKITTSFLYTQTHNKPVICIPDQILLMKTDNTYISGGVVYILFT